MEFKAGKFLGFVYVDSQEEADAFLQKFRERNAARIPPEDPEIIAKSKREQVYIYNVGPKTFDLEMGSYGSKTIPALPLAKCLNGNDLAGPVIIPGCPSECYPAPYEEGEDEEGKDDTPKEWIRTYYAPAKWGVSRNAGLYLAMEITRNLDQWGVFISTEETPSAKQIQRAQDLLRERLVQVCEFANDAYRRHKFGAIREYFLFDAAKILNKTPAECPWMTIEQR